MVESCIGPSPLSPVAAMGRPLIHALPPGSAAVLSVRMATADGPWLRAAPLTLAGA